MAEKLNYLHQSTNNIGKKDVKVIKEGGALVSSLNYEQCVENTNNYDISPSSNSLSPTLAIAKKVQIVQSH